MVQLQCTACGAGCILKRFCQPPPAAEIFEAIWEDGLKSLMRKLGREAQKRSKSGKWKDWKLAFAAEMRASTTVTNHWLATKRRMGNLYEVSRKVSAWRRDPDLQRKLR